MVVSGGVRLLVVIYFRSGSNKVIRSNGDEVLICYTTALERCMEYIVSLIRRVESALDNRCIFFGEAPPWIERFIRS